MTVLITLLILTDISAVYFAKRIWMLITEESTTPLNFSLISLAKQKVIQEFRLIAPRVATMLFQLYRN
ncbi:MAG: hypothetical protein RLZ23_1106 [Actinomycetota bacterium]